MQGVGWGGESRGVHRNFCRVGLIFFYFQREAQTRLRTEVNTRSYRNHDLTYPQRGGGAKLQQPGPVLAPKYEIRGYVSGGPYLFK